MIIFLKQFNYLKITIYIKYMNTLFDIVIPVGPKDLAVLKEMVEYTKKNIIGYRNIYLVSNDISISIINCINIDENIFPFDKQYISSIIGDNNRIGWYLQQLIKLYAGSVINNILSNYLVIDCDTSFLKPTFFFNNNLPLYNYGTEYHIPYFDQMFKLHPSLTKQTSYSGICHHMMFQQDILLSLFNLIEKYHNKAFYQAFLSTINFKDILFSGASEYEIYFNFLHIYHKEKFIVRELKWENSPYITTNSNLNYVSCHHYMK